VSDSCKVSLSVDLAVLKIRPVTWEKSEISFSAVVNFNARIIVRVRVGEVVLIL
jgi:hypothetical protein